jgi:hypothetical protein
MALRGALTHWKTRRLALRLQIEPWAALGILEALWHCTAEDAPGGNIGRLPDDAIAAQMFYGGNPAELMAALVESRHLEPHVFHRYIVHDWHIHADYNTKRKLIRRKENILDNSGAELHPMTRHDSSETGHDASETRHNPFPTRYNPTPVPAPGPVPAPEPEPVPPSGESGAAAPHPDKAGSRSAQKGAGRGKGASVAGLAAAVARNNAALGAGDPPIIAESIERRSEWARGEVKVFLASVRGLVPSGADASSYIDRVPWGERDEKALRELLKYWPGGTQDEMRRCLQNRAESIALGYFSSSSQPSKWLRDLPSFEASPLNNFNEPPKMVQGRYRRKGE